jgi:PAS domain S-box-containing protein
MMDTRKTKAQLIDELESLRAKVKLLEGPQVTFSGREEYNLSVAENAPVGIALYRNGITLYVNQTYLQMSGYDDSAALIGKHFTELVAPSCRQELIDRNRHRELGENVPDSYETIYLRKDGTEYPVHIQAAYIVLPDGPATIGFFTDITERKQAEEALREKTEELDRFFSLALDLLCIADIEGYFIRLNTAWENTLGYQLEDLEGRRFLDLVHPDDREQTLAAIAALSAGQQVVDFVNRYQCKDGSYRWIEWRSVPYQNRLIYAAARDITKHKRADEALRESEEKFRHTVEASPMGIHIYRLEPDNRLVFIGANPAADHILSVANRQFVGKTLEEAFPPLVETEVPRRYRLAAAQGEAWHTSQINYEEGRISGAFDVYAFQTSPGHMAAMFVDITERKRTEVALQQYTARLEILHEIDQAILLAETPRAVAGAVLEHLRELIPCQRASVSLFDFEHDEVEVLASHVSGETQVGTGLKMPVQKFGIDAEILHGNIALVNDLGSQSSLSHVRQMLLKEGIHAIINVPLLVQGKP